MDRTAKDDPYIRSWYEDADKLKTAANVVAYPTLLFYSATGDLLLNTFGYKDVVAMKTLAAFTSDPSVAAKFNKDLEAYKAGKKDYQKMIALSRTVNRY